MGLTYPDVGYLQKAPLLVLQDVGICSGGGSPGK